MPRNARKKCRELVSCGMVRPELAVEMVIGLDLGGSGGPAWRAISKAVTRDSPMWRTTARPGGHGLQIETEGLRAARLGSACRAD